MSGNTMTKTLTILTAIIVSISLIIVIQNESTPSDAAIVGNEDNIDILYTITSSAGDTNGEVMIGGGYTIAYSRAIDVTTRGSIIIPEKVTIDGAIYDVTSISQFAFQDCRYITSLSIPESVTYIGGSRIDGGAFEGCEALVNIKLPSGIEEIGSRTFANCTSLEEITISENVHEIEEDAFNGCTSLKQINFNGTQLDYVSEYAFTDCPNLPTIFYGTSFTQGVFEFMIVDPYNHYVKANGFTNQNSCEIPESVTYNGEEFTVISVGGFDNSNLTSITIPETVTYIGNGAFRDSRNLTEISLESVKHIGKNAFRNCRLGEVEIPESVISIDEYAFSSCSIYQLSIPETIESIDQNAFDDMTFCTYDLKTEIVDKNELKGHTYGLISIDSERMVQDYIYGGTQNITYVIRIGDFYSSHYEEVPGNKEIILPNFESLFGDERIEGKSIMDLYAFRGWAYNGEIINNGDEIKVGTESMIFTAVVEEIPDANPDESNNSFYYSIIVLCLVGIIATIVTTRLKK